MPAQADARPIGGLAGVGEWITVFRQGRGKFMRQVRMAAAVAAALGETQVRFLFVWYTPLVVYLAMLGGSSFAKSGHFTRLGISDSGSLAV